MAIFAIYRYNLRTFKKLENLFSDDEEYQKHAKYESPEELFESFIGKTGQPITGIADVVEKGRGKNRVTEWEKHGNEIEQHKDNIIVFRLQANKSKKINKEDWTKDTVGHYPDCRVIIDNRKGSNLMVIERKTTTFSDPDKAMELLQSSFNRMMYDYGVAIEFERLSKQESFWNAVNEIREKFGDVVNRVQFDFKGEEQKEDDGSFTFKLMQWASLFAENSSLVMNVGDDTRLKQVEQDLTRMSELCYRNRYYNLTVKFRDFGLFRYGQDIKAQFGLEDEVIENFIGRVKQLDAFEDNSEDEKTLTKWFDRVNILFDDYGKKTLVDKKRNNEGRV